MLSTADKLTAIARCPLFRSIEPAALGLLAEMMTVENFHAAEAVFEAGAAADRVLLICAGELAVEAGAHGGSRRIMGAGEVLGEYGLFADERRTASVRAVADTLALSLDYVRFERFLRLHPDVLFRLMQTAVSRLVELESRLKD